MSKLCVKVKACTILNKI